ncbi:hypothetical protein NXC24_CH00830 [Rhizobium sp. NXC24]|nr:hypothetical protein NXC24_CH00830 [Rhizobium sp. NXC24]
MADQILTGGAYAAKLAKNQVTTPLMRAFTADSQSREVIAHGTAKAIVPIAAQVTPL